MLQHDDITNYMEHSPPSEEQLVKKFPEFYGT